MKNMLQIRQISVLFFVGLVAVVLIGAQTAQASSLILDADKTEGIRINEVITIPVLLSIDCTPINVISGTLSFDTDMFALEGITTSESVVTTWIIQPEMRDDYIEFAAMFPRGFAGVMEAGSTATLPGNLFTLELRAKEAGTARVSFSDIEAMHDQAQIISPQHTATLLTVEQIRTVPSTPPVDTDSKAEPDEDTAPPRSFMPYIIQPDTTCGSPVYVAFQTTDDDSGISHYEVGIAESEAKLSTATFETSESPYELRDVRVGSWVAVKAVDNAGNERVESIQIMDSNLRTDECDAVASSESSNLIYLLVLLILLVFMAWQYHLRNG